MSANNMPKQEIDPKRPGYVFNPLENMLTQQAVADYLHIRQNTYSQYETAQRQVPIEMLIALSDFYDVSLDYLLGLTDEETRYPRPRG